MADIIESTERATWDQHVANKSNPHETTAAQVGALALNGGTITGDLKISKVAPYLRLEDTTSGRTASLYEYNTGWMYLQNSKDSNNRTTLIIAPETESAKNWIKIQNSVNGTHTGYSLYGEHYKPSAADVGATPFIDARSASFDMSAIMQSGVHRGFYATNADTLGTPNKQGLTTLSSAFIMSYANSTTYGIQLAYISGAANPIAARRFNNGTLYDWFFPYVSSTGGTFTGNISISKSSAPQLILKNTNATVPRQGYLLQGNDGYLNMQNYLDANNSQTLYIKRESDDIQQAVRLSRKISGTTNYYDMYGTHNITKGTTDLTAGSSALTTNAIYFVYE